MCCIIAVVTTTDLSLSVVYISLLLVMSFLSVVGNILVVVSKQWDQTAQIDGIQLCSKADNTAQTLLKQMACSCVHVPEFAKGNKCDSVKPGGVGKENCISEKPLSANKATRSLSSQLNRAFFILSCILFVFISCLMLALIRM